MLRHNHDHKRPSLFNTAAELPSTVRRRREASPASDFYETWIPGIL